MRQQKEVWKRFRLIFIRLFPIGVTKFLTHFSPVCHYVGTNPLVCIVNQWTFLTKVARLVWKELKCYADKMLCWRSKSPLEYGGNPVKKSNTKTGGYFLFGANVGRLCCCFCSCFCLFFFCILATLIESTYLCIAICPYGIYISCINIER